MSYWAFIPARGGSKSIPKKNLAALAGQPLLHYCLQAAIGAGIFDRIICSTDDEEISAYVSKHGVEIDQRPDFLATDEAPVSEVVIDFFNRTGFPDVIFLIQPTSPFLLSAHLHNMKQIFENKSEIMSVQTVAECSHNSHEWNQREIVNGECRFVHSQLRKQAPNKQSKPKRYLFGNCVAARSKQLIRERTFFATPSFGIEIPSPYHFDVDQPKDLEIAEAIINQGLVKLEKVHCLAETPAAGEKNRIEVGQ